MSTSQAAGVDMEHFRRKRTEDIERQFGYHHWHYRMIGRLHILNLMNTLYFAQFVPLFAVQRLHGLWSRESASTMAISIES